VKGEGRIIAWGYQEACSLEEGLIDFAILSGCTLVMYYTLRCSTFARLSLSSSLSLHKF